MSEETFLESADLMRALVLSRRKNYKKELQRVLCAFAEKVLRKIELIRV